jgi:hypothetical protein
MIHYFKTVLIFCITLLGLFGFPIQGFTQNPDSAILQEVKPLPKETKFKGWYFGVNTGLFISGLTYTIPNDPVTGFGNGGGGGFCASNSGSTTEIGDRYGFQFIGKYVVGRVLTIDFTGTTVKEGGPLVLSRYVPGGEREVLVQDLNFITRQFVITPNLTLGPRYFHLLIGVGFGFATIHNRSFPNVKDKFPLKQITGILNLQTGFSSHIGGGIATLKIGLVQTGDVSESTWQAGADNFSALIGYTWPIATTKKVVRLLITK